MRILGLGHPRTGTGYTCQLLNSWGLDVGHEVLKKDGVIAWQLAPTTSFPLPYIYTDDLRYENYQWETIIYNVRNPLDSIYSIVYTEKSTLPFRRYFFKNDDPNYTDIECAIQSILTWDSIILSKQPHVVFRIENEQHKLFDVLSEKYLGLQWNDEIINIKYNCRNHPTFSTNPSLLENVRYDLKKQLNNFCIRYGYDIIF